MEELFRFLLTRPAQRADDKRTVLVSPSTEYSAKLKDARSSDDPIVALKKLALAERQSASSLKSIDQLNNVVPLWGLLEELSNQADRSLNDLNSMIKRLFGKTSDEVVGAPGFVQDRERLCDVLVTNALLGGDGPVSSDTAAQMLRTIATVERAAARDAELEAKGGIADALQRTLLLPSDVFPLTTKRTIKAPSPTSEPVPDKSVELAALIERRNNLVAAYSALTHVTPDHIAAPPETEGPVITLEKQVTKREEEVGEAERAADITAPTPSGATLVRGASLRLKPEAVAALGKRERAVLAERGLDLTRINLPTAVDKLSYELQGIEQKISELGGATHTNMIKVGAAFLPDPVFGMGTIVHGAVTVPMTHGTVAPAGIGDLLVVKQFLKRYEAREIAHIENILKGEYKRRIHRRSRTTEETITVETEIKREEERDQQTTERFELKTESSNVLKEDTSLKIGLSVSGSYGPTVEFKATTDFALNTSKEEATKVATSFSKDVTNRAISKIFERRREERILKTIEVFEEKNIHGVDNKQGSDHVIGQYQWIDKIYEAQVFNYGKRMLFDIMLPEPAAFLLHALSNQPKAGADLIKPAPFTVLPTDIWEWNYADYVRQYEVVGVTPPPQPYLTVAETVEGKGMENEGATKTLKIPLPNGYQAVAYEWQWRGNLWSGGSLAVVILPEPIDNKVGTITLAVKTYKIEAFTVSLAISCQLTDGALNEWKLKTHSAILQAYQKQLRDYEEKLAALQVQAAQEVQGRNPLENEMLIRAELKKGSISVFTDQHYDLFGAITSSTQGYPQPDLLEAAAEGKYIRFFEQAFEWEQMMFFFYPYFWGRKDNWVKRAILQDVDPLFAGFIKAGAARVVAPVRQGFEHAIAHFLDTAEIWDGGDLPPITSPLYVSIIEEIRERDKAPGSELPQGDPWEVRLPTTLIKLRDKATLPEWRKNAQGEWVSSETAGTLIVTGDTNFGNVAVNWLKDIVLSAGSSGASDLMITSATITDLTNFGFLEVNQFPALIPAGSSLPLHIGFQPKATGHKSANLTVSGHAHDSPGVTFNAVVQLTGDGI